MKKKIIPLTAALVCALGCTLALTACGGEEETGKYHSAEQWATAFSDPKLSSEYSLSQRVAVDPAVNNGSSTVQIAGLQYDSTCYYYFSQTQITMNGGALSTEENYEMYFKKDGHYYYNAYDDEGVFSRTYEIAAATVASKYESNAFKSVAQTLVAFCKTSYDKFEKWGAGNGINGDVHYYSAKNVSLGNGGNAVMKEIRVAIYDSNASLYNIEAKFDGADPTKTDGSNTEYSYELRLESYADHVDTLTAPDRLEGKTFKLYNITATDAEGGPVEGYDTWISNALAATANKTITAKADGRLEGDFSIETGGTTLTLDMIRYTENFTAEGTYGEITAYTLDNSYRLTGNIQYGFADSGEHGEVKTFELTIIDDGDYIHYIFALV